MRKSILVLTSLGATSLSLLSQSVDTLSVRQLQEVSVIGTRAGKTTPMSYGNIKKAELQKINLGQDVPFLLQLQPSVVATSEAGTGIGYTHIRVRGVDATGTNVTANGVPINDSESQAVFWVNMPDLVSSVEEMQLQRGIGTSSNGSGSFGASLNLRTSNLSTQPYAELGVSGGSFSTLRKNIKVGSGAIAKHFSADVRLSSIDSKGYVDRSTVDLNSYFLQLGYFNNNTVLKFITFGGKERTGIAWNGLEPYQEKLYGRTYNSAGDMYDNGKQYYHNTDNYKQQHNHLIFTQRINPQLSLNLTGHYTRGFGYTDEFRTGRRPSEYGLKLYTTVNKDGEVTEVKRSLIRQKYLDNHFGGIISNLNYKPKGWDINWGFSGNYYGGEHYGYITWIERSFPDEVLPNNRYYESVGKKLDLSTYIKANYSILPNLSAYIDLQYRHLSYRLEGTNDRLEKKLGKMQRLDINKHFDFLNPKAGLYWRFTPRQHAYASIALAHREPNRKMYTDRGVNEAMPRPERMTDIELGYGYTKEGFSLSSNLYYMSYKDQLVMTGKKSDVGADLLENVPDSYRLGIELSAAYEPIRAIRLDASLALSQNRIKEYSYYIGKTSFTTHDTPIAYSPSVVASGSLTYKGVRNLEVSLVAQHIGKQYLDNSGNEDRTLPAYTLTNLRLGYRLAFARFVKDCQLNLQINNLFNNEYASSGFAYAYLKDKQQISSVVKYPQAGINLLLGATLRF